MKINLIIHLIFALTVSIVLINCSSDNELGELNPNSNAYKKIVISQEAKELDKIKEKKVSSRKTYSKFTPKYVKSGAKELLVERINFDGKGNKTEQYRYISNGDVDLQWLYNYNYYGQPTITETYDGFQKLIFKEIKSYNSAGYIDKIDTWTEKTRAYATTEFEYDTEYNLIKEVYRNTKSEIIESKEYAYDNFKRDSLKLINNQNQIVYSMVFDYNEDTLLVLEKQTDRVGKTYTTKYEYDETGNLIKIDNSVLSDWFYEYDKNGNVITEIENNSEGFLQSKFTYKYDANSDLLIEKIRYDGEDDPAVIIRYEYEYF